MHLIQVYYCMYNIKNSVCGTNKSITRTRKKDYDMLQSFSEKGILRYLSCTKYNEINIPLSNVQLSYFT